MENVLRRNSGATLCPAMVKTAPNGWLQSLRMQELPEVFAPILLTSEALGMYAMPLMGELPMDDDVSLHVALMKLQILWEGQSCFASIPNRVKHHELYVAHLIPTEMENVVSVYYALAREGQGLRVEAVHGDATLENIMIYQGKPVWIDPSTRCMPPEAEFDCAKLLQTQLGYNGYTPRKVVSEFINSLTLNRDLLIYYLLTHIVRLYNVQPQARQWALNVVYDVHAKVEEVLQCKW